MVALSLPLAAQHKPLLHAWISCILVMIGEDDPKWKQESVIHYDHAVRGLKVSILDGSPSHEWKRATALLCHAIELLQPVPSSNLARSHLSGAHHMFQLTKDDPNVPASEHDALLFEAYILRTANNCLLQQDIHQQLPFDYLHHLNLMHQRSLDRMSLEMSPRDCPWLAVPGPTLIDLLYRISWLNAHHPLSEDLYREAVNVGNQLSADEESQRGTDGGPREYLPERSIWRSACKALLRSLLLGASAGSVGPEYETAVSEGSEALDVLTQVSSEDYSLLWPLIVLGALSSSGQHRDTCLTVAERYRTTVPGRIINSILSFWSQAWTTEDKALRFKDSELLRSILL